MTNDTNPVGYKQPPKHTQFKPGQSGNPKGRPKGTQNLATDLAEELRRHLQTLEKAEDFGAAVMADGIVGAAGETLTSGTIADSLGSAGKTFEVGEPTCDDRAELTIRRNPEEGVSFSQLAVFIATSNDPGVLEILVPQGEG